MITLAKDSVVVLIGASGAGKSTWAERVFPRGSVLSSDHFRELVSGSSEEQGATRDAFELLFAALRARSARGILSVVDATSLKSEDRAGLLTIAKEFDLPAVAVVFPVSEEVALARNAERERRVPEGVIRRHVGLLAKMGRKDLSGTLRREGFAQVEILTGEEGVELVENETAREEVEVFDVVGGGHGDAAALWERLGSLGHISAGVYAPTRCVVVAGDMVGRSPGEAGPALSLLRDVLAGGGIAVAGEEEDLLLKAVRRGEEVPGFSLLEVEELLTLPAHVVLAGGEVVVSHHGLLERRKGRVSGRIRGEAVHGRGERASFLSRRDVSVHAHEDAGGVVVSASSVGLGSRSEVQAWRWPEREVVGRESRALSIETVLGDRRVFVEGREISIPAERGGSALEVLSRWSVAPEGLCYLPATMSPVDASWREGYLEHTDEALSYFRRSQEEVILEEKHMGSRGVLVVSEEPRLPSGLFTRTGRRVLSGEAEERVLAEARRALGAIGEERRWVVLDCEVLPWDLLAGGLVEESFSEVGRLGRGALSLSAEVLAGMKGEAGEVARRAEEALSDVEGFDAVWRRYASGGEVEIAVFSLLASEEGVEMGEHLWGMEVGARLAEVSSLFRATRHLVVGVEERERAAKFFEEICALGGEGVVVKPLRAESGVQPGLKVRGREYLRIVYGAGYLRELPELKRSRSTKKKRELAQMEHLLSFEALRRTHARLEGRGSLASVHECVAGVLALESDAVDPTL